MGSCLVINSTPTQMRIALLEQGVPVEVHMERTAQRSVVGSIYQGRVVRVLPGMQAAFVDIGLERTAFLYVNDALPQPCWESSETLQGSNAQGYPEGPTLFSYNLRPVRQGFRTPPRMPINAVLKQGEKVIVQVQKPPLGTKGARVSRHVTLPGRFLVLMPFYEHLGISQHITHAYERERLEGILRLVQPVGMGFIARTAAEGIDAQILQSEALRLVQIWQEICQKARLGPAKQLLFADVDLLLRAARDMVSETIERIVVDTPEDYQRIRRFITTISPRHAARVQYYNQSQPIFEYFGIEQALDRALKPRVNLKSGGYLVIDQTEALTVIDVNSGRCVGTSSLEETITQINLEAVQEAAYQIRLRNVSGMIIIDLIDMTQSANRNKVLYVLGQALSRDKVKTTIVKLSEIGLVEITRKRVRDSLNHLLTEPCLYCQGKGFIKNEPTMAQEILQAITRLLTQQPTPHLCVHMQPDVARYLYTHHTADLKQLEHVFNTCLAPMPCASYHRERYELVHGTCRT